MNKTSSRSGFLLLEALIAISLLATAVLALSDSFSAIHSATSRCRRKKALADCAQNQILHSLSGVEIEAPRCTDALSWSTDRRTLAPPFEGITLTSDGEPFEIVRAAK